MIPYFQNKTCLIVTKHQKELVIAPALESSLGLKCIHSDQFNTDLLGTFSGEIERIKDPISTVKDKCLLGVNYPGIDFIVASEGSFGPHPYIPFVYADEELIGFYDIQNEHFLVEKQLFLDVNFGQIHLNKIEQLETFLTQYQFPSHGVILKIEDKIIKDENDKVLIYKTISEAIQNGLCCSIETDMRAMSNPTRMAAIAQLAKKLAQTLTTNCDQCQSYGFAIKEQVPGLQCSICKRPTKSIHYHLYRCWQCGFEEKKLFPNQKYYEEPTFCDWCNP